MATESSIGAAEIEPCVIGRGGIEAYRILHYAPADLYTEGGRKWCDSVTEWVVIRHDQKGAAAVNPATNEFNLRRLECGTVAPFPRAHRVHHSQNLRLLEPLARQARSQLRANNESIVLEQSREGSICRSDAVPVVVPLIEENHRVTIPKGRPIYGHVKRTIGVLRLRRG
jgi:hypothetical protein